MTAPVGVRFEVPGLPQPQGSTRGFRVGDRVILTSDNRKLRSWRREVVVAAQEAMAGQEPLLGPVIVKATFSFPRPAGHYNKAGLRASAPQYKTTQPDLDKLARALLDGLMVGGVIRDDSQVVSLTAGKEFGVACTRVYVVEAVTA